MSWSEGKLYYTRQWRCLAGARTNQQHRPLAVCTCLSESVPPQTKSTIRFANQMLRMGGRVASWYCTRGVDLTRKEFRDRRVSHLLVAGSGSVVGRRDWEVGSGWVNLMIASVKDSGECQTSEDV